MPSNTPENTRDTLLRRSLHAISLLEGRLKEVKDSGREPIAVVGMGCRFPGGCSTPEAYWRFLERKGDGVIEIPSDRWNIDEWYDPNAATPDKMYIRQAGFLQEDVKGFDARFFQISPMEAIETDPQQRILLEVSWEALENAGLNPDQLKGSKTGVFIGIIGSEYSVLPRDMSKINLYAGTGTMNCIASGRIAYTLGLHGPAVSIDTACSSSLVGVHYACESLRKRECDMALAGGVNLILSPISTAILCMFGALARDGRCKPFDESGDGYGRGEGCGVVVLKRHSDAIKDGNRILALIRGGAVNNDGPGSGLTVPNGKAQEAILCQALENAGVSPEDVTYLEAHGTGTSLGDPIEFNALTRVFGKGRAKENPLFVGSVKGNIGHLEAASGIAGLIKVILSLQHKMIPPNVQLENLNQKIQPDRIPAIIPLEPMAWPGLSNKARMAGISSFGFSGTNAHLILSETPEDPGAKQKHAQHKDPLCILTLSGKSQEALYERMTQHRTHLESVLDQDVEDICYTANTGRAHFFHRAALVAQDREDMLRSLKLLESERAPSTDVYLGVVEEELLPKPAFLFSGDLNDVAGLARELLDSLPSFQQMMTSCDQYFKPCLEGSLLGWLYDGAILRNKELAKDASIFSIQYALARTWESFGIRPFAVIGKGAGAYAAACIAGVMTLEAAIGHISRNATLLSGQPYKSPKCRLICPDTGKPFKNSETTDPSLWARGFDRHASFEKGLEYLAGQGCHLFMELLTDCPDHHAWIERKRQGSYLPGIESNGSWKPIFRNAARLYCAGAAVDWKSFHQYYPHRLVELPTYPFQRKPYWVALQNEEWEKNKPEKNIHNDFNQKGALEETPVHSILNENRFEYQFRLNLESLSEAKDVGGILHVGYYYELLSRAVHHAFRTTSFAIHEADFISALILPDHETLTVGLLLEPEETDALKFRFCSRHGDGRWNTHVKGGLSLKYTLSAPERSFSFDAIKTRCTKHHSGTQFYQMMQDRGVTLGQSVKWVEEIWFEEREALARFRAAASNESGESYHLQVHPGIMDACAQIFHAALPSGIPADMTFMVSRWEDFVLTGSRAHQELWCHASLDEQDNDSSAISGTFTLLDGSGKTVLFARRNVMKGISATLAEAMRNAEAPQERDVAVLERLDAASVDGKKSILGRYFCDIMSGILGTSLAEPDIKEPLRNLGMDSMVAVRFKASVSGKLGLDIPIDMLIEGPSILRLAEMAVGLTTGQRGKIEILAEKVDRDRWFSHRKTMPDPRIRLFCFPYGGGGASLYREWQDLLPRHIEVCPIQLPGRENRIREAPIEGMEEMIDTLETVLRPEMDRPYALYGHSMGALIAFRVAYRLRKIFPDIPAILFAGGFRSPLIYPSPTAESVRQHYHQNKRFSALQDPELVQTLLHTLESDLKVLRSWKPLDEPVFDIPVTLFHGQKDTHIHLSHTEGWKDVTAGRFCRCVLPGDHYFLEPDQSRNELLDLISRELDAMPSSNDQKTRRPIPTCPEEITPEWLTDVLRSTGKLHTTSIVSVETSDIGDIQGFLGSVVRLRPKYLGDQHGAPDSLIAKFPSADPHARKVFGRLKFYENEIRFYREIAPGTDVAVPHHYGSEMDKSDHRYLLLLEDMSPSMQVGDCVAGCSQAEAELSIRHIAHFHACFWKSSRVAAYEGQIPALNAEAWVIREKYRECLTQFHRSRPESASPYLVRLSEKLADHIPGVYRQWSMMPRTLVHGDYRLDNLFFNLTGSSRKIVVADWQNLRIGPGAIDTAFFLCLNLDQTIRKTIEKGLSTAYCNILNQNGINDYTHEHCLDDYRWCVFFPLIRCMMFFSDKPSKRVESLVSVMLQRLSDALEDNQAEDLLNSLEMS